MVGGCLQCQTCHGTITDTYTNTPKTETDIQALIPVVNRTWDRRHSKRIRLGHSGHILHSYDFKWMNIFFLTSSFYLTST